MQIGITLLEQLLVYGVLGWALFAAIAFYAGRYGGLVGVVLGHLSVAAIIIYLDLRWILSAMKAPDWDGSPDMDIVFHFGLLIRIVLVNTLLLPISIVAAWRSAHRDAHAATPSSDQAMQQNASKAATDVLRVCPRFACVARCPGLAVAILCLVRCFR